MALETEEASRTLLYNQDPGVLFAETDDPIEPTHVDEMIDEVARGDVDVFLANVNMWRTNYPSDVWETWWDGYDEWAAENPPMDTRGNAKTVHWHHPKHPKRHHMIRQMQRLATEGCDYLKRLTERCREQGVTPGVSIRINDRHDTDPTSQYFSEFYRENPQLRLESDDLDGTGGLDYQHPAVRDHVASLVEEVVTDYDVEVIELDYMRHPPFFDANDASDETPTMTAFVERIARLCERELVAVVPRVPATPANAMELGLDVESWVESGLIDGLIAATWIKADWQVPVDRWRDIVGETPFFVSVDKYADNPPGLPRREIPDDARLLRGIEASYAETDVDGLYFFNFFGPRERPLDPGEPLFDELSAVKHKKRLRGSEKVYLATSAENSRGHSPAQVPTTLRPGDARAVTLSLLDEPASAVVTVRAVSGQVLEAEDLSLHVNDDPIGSAEEVRPYERSGYRGSQSRVVNQAVFAFPPESRTAGENCLVFENRGPRNLPLDGVEVHVDDENEL